MQNGTLRELADKKGLLVGAAVNHQALVNDEKYGEVLKREFNCLVAENSMKFDATQPRRGHFNFAPADTIIAFAKANNMKVRGHNLVWFDAVPKWLAEGTFSRSEALAIMREHITTVVGHFKNSVFAWDVINESLDDKDGFVNKGPWMKAIGSDYFEQAFIIAHEADPAAQLFINGGFDWISETGTGYSILKQLLSRGVPIHGIGLEFHEILGPHHNTSEVFDHIKRFNDLGLTVHITELEVQLLNPVRPELFVRQATVYKEVFSGALASKNCPAVLLWGFTDKHSWIPEYTKNVYGSTLIFDELYKAKPAYQAIREVLCGQT
jgi:endo-1,4-beta-xylanase